MTRALRVIAAGPNVSIQDRGRIGHLRSGVGTAGPMDWLSFERANRLVDNRGGEAALEIALGGLAVEAMSDCLLAVASTGFRIEHDRGELPPIVRIPLCRGERLRIRAAAQGSWCYLAVAGGIIAPQQLGSRATHVTTGLGPPLIVAGDLIACGTHIASAAAGVCQPHPIDRDDAIPVILGPQDDAFSDDAIETFLSAEYTVTHAVNRMGYRLAGPQLAHRAGHDIVSDGIAPGSVQVPGDGQPTILMADRQPTGGYPKIATLTRLGIAKFAQMRPGDQVRFKRVCREQARAALLAAWEELDRLDELIKPLGGVEADAAALHTRNLISGVVDAHRPMPK